MLFYKIKVKNGNQLVNIYSCELGFQKALTKAQIGLGLERMEKKKVAGFELLEESDFVNGIIFKQGRSDFRDCYEPVNLCKIVYIFKGVDRSLFETERGQQLYDFAHNYIYSHKTQRHNVDLEYRKWAKGLLTEQSTSAGI